MQIQRAIPILIEPDPALLAVVTEFNRYQNVISPVCFNDGEPLHALELHKAVYHSVPSVLNAQMKCSAIRATAGAYATAKSNKHSIIKPFRFRGKTALFIAGNGRDASFQKGLLSITTAAGRKKLPFRIPAHFQHDFDAAIDYDAIRIRSNGKATLCLTLEVPNPVGSIPVGVDVGIRNLIVASTATKTLVISGSLLNQRNRRTRKTRSRLQRKHAEKKAQHQDTRSVRRVLKRLSRRIHNRNDTVAKQSAAALCKWAPKDAVLVFEDLKIKHKPCAMPIRKGARRKLNEWFYRRLIQTAKNRAERGGLAVAIVDPAFSSQTCCKCGTRGIRKGRLFNCSTCKSTADADVNASHNLRLTFAVLRDGGHLSTCPETRSSDAGELLAKASGS